MKKCKTCGNHEGYHPIKIGDVDCKQFIPNEAQVPEDVEITDFNKCMSREERNYIGEQFDENR